jgi:sugar phosphate isomerase/epimerase
MKTSRFSRRSWMRSAAALASGLTAKAASERPFRHAIGVQLYTVRSVIGSNPDDILRRIAEIGYTEVETTGGTNIDTLAPILRKYKLKPVSGHIDAAVVTGQWPPGRTPVTLMQTLEWAKQYGFSYMVFPAVPAGERKGGSDAFRKIADQLNEAGRRAKAAGVTLCYHNHAYEFGGKPGERPIDIYLERFDKSAVYFELDVFWLSVAGQNPVDMLNQLKGRVPLVHLKDKPRELPVAYNESVPHETFKEVGSGSLDFPAILRTAEATGVKHYFVEQDQTPGDPVESLAKSFQYLRSVKL